MDGCDYHYLEYFYFTTYTQTFNGISDQISFIPWCGDYYLAGSENCEDGNSISNDGCSSQCQIEQGFIPTNNTISLLPFPQGINFTFNTMCKDGRHAFPIEQCDDGNNFNGDGCDTDCQIEPFWRIGYYSAEKSIMDGVCSDQKKRGFESCDDGN